MIVRRPFLAGFAWLALSVALAARAADPDNGADWAAADAGTGTPVTAVLAAIGSWFYEDIILVPCQWVHGSWRRAWREDRLVPGRGEVPAPGGAAPSVTYPYRAEDRLWLAPRVPGEGTLPFARLDLTLQYDTNRQYLQHHRLELGFGPVAVDAQHSRIQGGETAFEFERVQALLRLSFSEEVEVDVGGGLLFTNLGGWHRGLVLTLPILIHPSEYFGLEFRPSVGDVAGDDFVEYDVSAYVSYRFAALRVGYRWLYGVEENLSGPEFGLTLRY